MNSQKLGIILNPEDIDQSLSTFGSNFPMGSAELTNSTPKFQFKTPTQSQNRNSDDFFDSRFDHVHLPSQRLFQMPNFTQISQNEEAEFTQLTGISETQSIFYEAQSLIQASENFEESNEVKYTQSPLFSTFQPDLYSLNNSFQDEVDHDDFSSTSQRFLESPSDIAVTQYESNENCEMLLDIEDGLSTIPESITNLHKSIRENYSDYCFSYALSAQICSESVPMASYINLKLSLLLSIVSIQNSTEVPIPIVAIGQNTGDANIIMTYIGRLAERFLRNVQSGATINKKNVIEAGPLLLAKGGICYLDDWSGIKTLKCAQLIREVETGRVMVEKAFQSFPIQCAVWTYWTVKGSIRKDLITLNHFVNVFGIPIIMEEDTDHDVIIDFLLNQESKSEDSKPNELNISEHDMKVYLDFVSKQNVSMSNIAEKMLQDYFLVTRVNRPNALNQKSFQILKQLSESHAKMCFRNIVNGQDVLVAVSICETFIRTFFPDSFHMKSSPGKKTFDSFEDVENYMSELSNWFFNITATNNVDLK